MVQSGLTYRRRKKQQSPALPQCHSYCDQPNICSMVFLDSLYSPPHPHHFQLLSAEKYVSLVCVFFYKSCEKKTIPLILSPESQVTLTILSTLHPLYHNPHSHSLQFTNIYYISYKIIFSLHLYLYLYIFRPLYHNPHSPIKIHKKIYYI